MSNEQVLAPLEEEFWNEDVSIEDTDIAREAVHAALMFVASRPSAPRVMDREALRQKVIGNIAAAVLEKSGQLDVARLADAILALSATPVDVGEVVEVLGDLLERVDCGCLDDERELHDRAHALHDRLTGKDRG